MGSFILKFAFESNQSLFILLPIRIYGKCSRIIQLPD